MKLLFYIGAMNGGGAQRVMANLVNGLVNKGHHLYLAYDMNQKCVFDLDGRIELLNSREGCVPNVWYKRTHFYRRPRYLLNLRKIAKRIRPDIVISFMTDINSDVITMLAGLNIPIVVSEHTNISRNRGKKISLIHKYLYPKASAITVLTKHDYEYWKNYHANIYYMPNPSDPAGKPYAGVKEKVVLSAGRVTDWKTKGFDNLIKAWSIICDDVIDWKLQIVGAGKDSDFYFLKSLVAQCESKNVEFLGFRTDLQQLMKQSEIYCLASRYEGLPMALIEAMNANCCCVAFDCKTGPREIIDNGVSGLLVEDQNVEALSKTLLSVIKNDKLRESLSKNAPLSVVQYSTDNIISRWNNLFAEILK